MMQVNDKHDPIITMDFHCDLFKRKAIKPESLLKSPEDVERVREAMAVITEFERALIDNDLMEEL